MKTKSNMIVTKPNNEWEKIAFLFHNTYEGLAPKFGYETRKDTKEFDPESNNGKLMIATCKAVISKTLQQQREDLIKETKIDLEDEYDNGFEDGVEQANKHLKKDLLSEIESKSVFVKAYKNGPILADSLIITFDDWLELKSGRKSKISYKNLETNLEKK